MYLHYTRKILNKALIQLKWFEQANVCPNTVIPNPKTNELTAILENLISAIKKEHPNEAGLLTRCLPLLITHRSPKGVRYNAYVLGEIIGLVNVLDGMYEEVHKIFISHSSADKEIVKAFVEKILMLGCGFDKDDIFCTLNSDAINIGDDFRNSIIDNMHCCDYIFLMISENYRNSEICHNEVGAAWALQNTKRVIPLKFPNIGFSQDDLGVLNVVKQAGSLNNKQQLIKIYEELYDMYDIKSDFPRFVQYADDFIEIVKKQKSPAAKGTKTKGASNVLLDSLSHFDKKHLMEWAKSEDGECWIIESMDGKEIEFGEVIHSVNGGREKAKWDDFFERMLELGFAIVDRLNSDGSPIYKMKKAAYDYVDNIRKELE